MALKKTDQKHMTTRSLSNTKCTTIIPKNSKQNSWTIEVSEGLTQSDWEAWDEFVPDENLMLKRAYIEGVKHSMQGESAIRFGRILDEGKCLCGAVVVHIAIAESNNLQGNTEKKNSVLQQMLIKVLTGNRPLRFRIGSIGNPFASGENGYYFCPRIDTEMSCLLLYEVLEKTQELEKEQDNSMIAYLVKDFARNSEELELLGKKGFAEFMVDPLMVMPILPSWTNFDDYLADLVSKFRTKAKSAIKKAAKIEIKAMSAEDIKANKDRFDELYHNVADKADFTLGHLHVDSFIQLKEQLNERFDVYGYYLDGKLIAFLSGIHHGKLYDAHMIGLDYDYNQEYGLYMNILYKFVDLAIQANAEKLSYGRTAGEIKSTVGAFPVALSCCVMHAKKGPNLLLRSFFKFVKPQDYDIRYPYKKGLEVIPPGL